MQLPIKKIFFQSLLILEDGAVIEVDAFDNLLTRFDKSLWASRYAVASWFYKCLESYKKEVGSVFILYHFQSFHMIQGRNCYSRKFWAVAGEFPEHFCF